MSERGHGSGTVSCDLAILVARTDTRFMLQTIPHLVRACRFPFARRLLVVDTAPLRRRYGRKPGIGTPEELAACCAQLVEAGVVDGIAPIDYAPERKRRLYRKHFTFPFRATHSNGGYPILGSIEWIDDSRADYVVHFDCDMMLHQAAGFNWIDEGIRLLREHSDLLAVLPRSGPPHPSGRLRQQEERGETYTPDGRGLYCLKTFTSRVFLMDRRRFESVLPVRPQTPLHKILRGYLTGYNAMPEWETMVGGRLRETAFIRADLASPHAWTLHPEERGERFESALPHVLARIEAGDFPADQAGYYDLLLDLWV